MAHVKKTKQANPGLQFKEVLQLAGKTYKKQQQGGGKHAMDHKDAFGNTESVNGGEPTEGGKEPVATLALENTEHVGSELTSTTSGGGRRRKSTKKAKKTKGKKKGGKKKMTKKKGKKSRRSRRRH